MTLARAGTVDNQGRLRVAIAGASGRMGRTLIDAVGASADCVLVAALDAADSPALGQDAMPATPGANRVPITSDLRSGLATAQVLIDFTRPAGTLTHAAICRELGVRLVVGTTGFTDAQKAEIAEHAQHIAIVMAPNMSVGVNVVLKLLETAARALDQGFDVEIVEAHHRHKVDAPSGTALKLGELVAGVLKKKDFAFGRKGDTGERPKKQIGYHSIRGGDIVGEHTVIYAGQGERVEITVRSQSRMTYALGALRAAKWLKGRPAGLYDMFDVLGLR